MLPVMGSMLRVSSVASVYLPLHERSEFKAFTDHSNTGGCVPQHSVGLSALGFVHGFVLRANPGLDERAKEND
jgi:hypothetical protein